MDKVGSWPAICGGRRESSAAHPALSWLHPSQGPRCSEQGPPRSVAVLTTTSYCQWIPERRGELPHLHHLLPPLPGHAPGQAAEPRGGHPDLAVDLHQVLPGSHLYPKQLEREEPPHLRGGGCTPASTKTPGTGVTQRRNEQHLGVETGLTLLLAAE